MYIEKLSWDNAARRCNSKREFFTLSCSPTGEDCTQAGGEVSDMLIECRALVNQLIRVHGEPPEKAEFILVRNDHELGTYYEVGIFFAMLTEDEMEEADADETPSQLYAQKCEMGIPDKWDKIAIAEMKEAGHTMYIPQAPAKVVKHQGNMRKLAIMVLAIGMIVGTTGFANVKVYDTGPPVTEYTVAHDVTVDLPVLNYEFSPVFNIVQDMNLVATDVGRLESFCLYNEKEKSITTVTPNKSNPAFIDRHRRTGYKLYSTFNIKNSAGYNSLSFIYRHRRMWASLK